jgi:hypothetical protein
VVPAPLSLIFLDLSSDPAEDRLAEELQLAGVQVSWASAPDGFGTFSLPAQLDQVRPGLAPGAPTAWLVVDGDALHLSIAFVEAERAVVRVADAPRGAEARLALTARELVSTAVPAAPAPLPPAPAPSPAIPAPAPARGLDWHLSATGTFPVPVLAPRAGVEVEVGATLGLAVGLQLGAGQQRGTGSLVGRWRSLRAGVGADLVHLPWVVWVEPRAELGLCLPAHRAVFVEPRIRATVLRDQVTRGDDVLYDSGWVEAGVVIGWRQIHRSP